MNIHTFAATIGNEEEVLALLSTKVSKPVPH